MKRLLLTLMIPILFCGGVWAQCPLNNIILTSQSEIDSFALNYPGCTVPVGYLLIESPDVDNLDGLSVITAVAGELVIRNNPNLTSLTSLQNLNAVSTIRIENNESLTDLSGLENVSTIGAEYFYGSGGVIVRNNIGLTSLNGLQGISSVNHLVIDGNPNLTNLAGLENLNTVIENTGQSNLALSGDIRIRNNDNLTDLTGLENLSSLETLYIRENINLTSITALENISSMRYLYIRENANLASITGLENVDTNEIMGIQIFSNPLLSVCGLPNICTFLTNGGWHEIHDNAPNCNSLAEIEEACIISFPVEISTPLQVRLKNQNALLTWRTETETNNAGFEIQRSKNGVQWERIGWQVGQGNSLAPYSYTYIDESPFLGTSYYRLKQVDFDGDFEYSGTVSLRYAPRRVSIYPNPVQDKLFIQTESPVQQLLIYDSLGKLVEASIDNNTIDVSIFPKGLYTIKVTIEDEDFYEKILVK